MESIAYYVAMMAMSWSALSHKFYSSTEWPVSLRLLPQFVPRFRFMGSLSNLAVVVLCVVGVLRYKWWWPLLGVGGGIVISGLWTGIMVSLGQKAMMNRAAALSGAWLGGTIWGCIIGSVASILLIVATVT